MRGGEIAENCQGRGSRVSGRSGAVRFTELHNDRRRHRLDLILFRHRCHVKLPEWLGCEPRLIVVSLDSENGSIVNAELDQMSFAASSFLKLAWFVFEPASGIFRQATSRIRFGSEAGPRPTVDRNSTGP